MSTAHSTHWKEEKWVWSFGQKTLRPLRPKHIWALKILN